MDADQMQEHGPQDEQRILSISTASDCVVHDTKIVRPSTHVFIVGVGHYPYFIDGGPDSFEEAELGQLSSPPVSARALARWFIDEYHYPPAPLGSVALLISDDTNVPFETASGNWVVPKPDYENFAKAADAWFERGNTDESNRLVFVFCGHGYGQGRISSLLMSDFNFKSRARWDSALDLGAFVSGMATCAAAEQIYFIDTCRRPHGALLAPDAAIGRTPVHAKADPREGFKTRVNAPLIFSTGDELPALAPEDGVSIFTAAFLKSMRGMAARDDNGETDWRVNNYSLLEAMAHESIRLTSPHFKTPQQPQSGEARAFDFHYLRENPVSPVYLVRTGGEACGPGDIHYELRGKPQIRSCNANDYEIELELPFGRYSFTLKQGEIEIAKTQQRSAPTWKRASLT
ncbi:caspase family protein [Pseudomonas sp. PH1b]|uniref:caspase family protein n=1 Tax=Pseudomonas sp. PH1b TaxID=1397282 RepID=UPI0012FEEAD0|nr:caspase family protein [Pseudomonas sp. PH1b]